MTAPDHGLRVLPVRGIGDVMPGDDLADLIVGAAPWLADGDILVVTSKIVSKAEGRLVDVPADGPERAAAREAILAAETRRTVARRGTTAIVQTRHGFVMASAGIDASNVDKTRLVLLPRDPDRSARDLRAALAQRYGLDVAVVVSDTVGRPWRTGQTDVALGAAGIAPLRDHRGELDPYGNELHVTQIAVIDELAAAAELVKGKSDGVPVAVVRGYPGAALGAPDGPGAAALVRDAVNDMFSLGTAEARAAGLRAAATLAGPGRLTGRPVDPDAVGRALATVATALAPGTRVSSSPPDDTRADNRPDDDRVGSTGPDRVGPVLPDGATAALWCEAPLGAAPFDLIRFGADLHRIRAALAAEGLVSALVPWAGETDVVLALSGQDEPTGPGEPTGSTPPDARSPG